MLSGCRNMRSDLGWREYLTLATTAVTVLSPYLAKAGEKAIEEVGKKLRSMMPFLQPKKRETAGIN